MTATVEQQVRISEQIREDLAGRIAGEIRSDQGTLSLYATDASLHQLMPLAVAFPANADDVSVMVRYAADHQIPVIARGSGTGLAGNSLGAGIVIDFSRHMNRILEIRDRTVLVEPGVILEDLNKALAATGRYFAPDPSNAAITTIGGMIGVDAAGSQALRVGSTRDHLARLQVVLADGSTHWLGTEALFPGLSNRLPVSGDEQDQYARVRVILRRLAAILKEHAELIGRHQPLLLRNSAGYMLRGVLQRGYINVPRLFAGSEGTLGLCTAAVLHTLPIPSERRVLLLLFSRFDQATASLPQILEFQPSACDLLDRRLLTLARESDIQRDFTIPAYAEAAMIVEFVDSEPRLLERRLAKFRHALEQFQPAVTIAVQTRTAEEARELWRLPRQVVPLLARIKGKARPVPIIEDIVVPPERVGDFLHQAQRVLQRFQVTASLYAHAGTGQLHLRPFLEMPTAASKGTYESLARDLYRVVQDHGGSISGEHGDGFSRTAFMRTQYGPLYRVFQQIKQMFDPQQILNPEKIVSSDPHLTIRHLRPDAELVSLNSGGESQLQWGKGELSEVAGQCNGCGQCKSRPQSGRMCPFYRVEQTEYASPRAKANTIRQYLQAKFTKSAETPVLPATDFTAPETLSTCFNCKQCQLECPSQVNIPHLWLEAKAADVLQNGLTRADWYLSRVHMLGGLLWRVGWLINPLLRTRPGRWLIEQLTGIDARRKLPPLARRPYLQQMRIRARQEVRDPAPGRAGQKAVVLFLDYYANYHDPQIVQATEAILRHLQVPYIVPVEQECSGMTLVNVGDLAAARELAEINLRVLGPYAREGHPILCIEPSSAVCLSQEYPRLLEHPDMKAVGQQTREVGQFLLGLHDQGLLKNGFSPIKATVGYHEPCHQRALSQRNPYRELLSLIPELELQVLDRGCSGMAGTYGLSQKNFDRSLQIGQRLIDAVIHENFEWASSECSACRMQMQQPEKKIVMHPLKLIASAYGLMPLDIPR